MNESSTAAAPEFPTPRRWRHDSISFLTIGYSHSSRTSVLTLPELSPQVCARVIVGVPLMTKEAAISSVHELKFGLPLSPICFAGV